MTTQAELEALSQSSQPVYLDQLTRHYRIWVYGEPGSGKTELAGNIIALSDKPACLVSTDSAWITLLKNKKAAQQTVRYPYQGFSQLRAMAQAAIDGVEPFCSYETLVWDTVSTAIDLSVALLVQHKKFNDQRDPDLASWSHYNLVATALRPTIDLLNRAPFNVIYLSHVRQPGESDNKKQIYSIRPNTPEACFKQISQEVQLIGWLNKEKTGGQRVLQVEGTNTVTGKSQIFTIPEGRYAVEDIPKLIQQWQEVSESFTVDTEIPVTDAAIKID